MGLGCRAQRPCQGTLPALLGGLIHTWVLSVREQKSGCLLQVAWRGSGDGAEVRCHRVVSSPRRQGRAGGGGPREGPTPGDGRKGRLQGRPQAGTDLAALWLPQASGQRSDPRFRAGPAVPLPLLAAAASSPGAWGGQAGGQLLGPQVSSGASARPGHFLCAL